MTHHTITHLTTDHIRPVIPEDVHVKFAEFHKDVEAGRCHPAALALKVIISKIEEIKRLSKSRGEQLESFVDHGRRADFHHRLLAEHEEEKMREKKLLVARAEGRFSVAKSEFEEAHEKLVAKEALMDTEEKAVEAAKTSTEIHKIAHHRGQIHEMYLSLLESQKVTASRKKTFVEVEVHLEKCKKEHAASEAEFKKHHESWVKMKEVQTKFEHLESLWRVVNNESRDFLNTSRTFEGELALSDGKGIEAVEAAVFKEAYGKIHGDWHKLVKKLEEAAKVQDHFKYRCGCCQKEHSGFPVAANETLLCEACKDAKHKK
jgi:hypothetical protein